MNRPLLSGWKKDPRDDRDFLVRPVRAEELPRAVDNSAIRPVNPAFRDQLQLGSCVGHGYAAVAGSEAVKAKKFVEWFSPMWIYNGARRTEGTLAQDEGCYPRDAAQWLVDHGALLEHFRPYTGKLDTSDPLLWALNGVPCPAEASKWPIAKYTRCDNGVLGICAALADGYLVVIGTPWPDRWMNPGKSGKLPVPKKCECKNAGGHCTYLFGYDQDRSLFKLGNSWGMDWALGGWAYAPFEAFDVFKASGRGYDAMFLTGAFA